jgi:hypothetical protein
VNRRDAAVGAFAVGQVFAGAAGLSGATLVAAEAVLIGLLLAGSRHDARALPAFAVGFGVLLGVLGAGRSGASLAVTAGALVIVGAVLVYGVHRYELVALGLVEG